MFLGSIVLAQDSQYTGPGPHILGPIPYTGHGPPDHPGYTPPLYGTAAPAVRRRVHGYSGGVELAMGLKTEPFTQQSLEPEATNASLKAI